MKQNSFPAARTAILIAFALLLATAAFAQPAYRTDRMSTVGVVTSMQQSGDQYIVTLNHGGFTYYVPAADVQNRNLRIGDRVRIDGFVNGNAVTANMIAFAGQPYYTRDPYYVSVPYGSNGWMSGVVTDVNRRLGYFWMTDDASGRPVKIDMRHLAQRFDFRRGDHLTVDGGWERRNLFDATRIVY